MNNNPFESEYKEELLTQIYNDIIKISKLSYSRLVEERTIFQLSMKMNLEEF